MENVLLGVTSKDLRCKFCDKSLRHSNPLENITSGACICIKLPISARSATGISQRPPHSEGMRPNMMKLLPSSGVEHARRSLPLRVSWMIHSDVHRQGKPYTCQHCSSKSFRRVRALKAHEAVCDNNPSKLPRVKCRLCPQRFQGEEAHEEAF